MSETRDNDIEDAKDRIVEEIEPRSLLVKNLDPNLRSDELKSIMGKYGDIKDIYIPLDYYSRKPRGFAFVEFHDSRDADSAKEELEGHEVGGRRLTIVYAKENRKTSTEMRRDSRRDRPSQSYRRRDRSDSRDRGYSSRNRRDHSRSDSRERRSHYRRSRSRSVDRRR